ncbi:MAG: hypothetical protein ABR501_05130 [Pyrinomonadaceae bacterium]
MKNEEFEKFDKVMGGLLSVSRAELNRKLKAEKRAKEKKKRPTSTASSRASVARKKHET